ncbi:hypothetical protein [Aquimarina aggregata]|uniref:hypothetical protein n=1 Tax=Aquimarina aggregata TaxID=1642818 RepID=UPI000AF70415|nr:hypothetical protein [Aquimarina aggregata]
MGKKITYTVLIAGIILLIINVSRLNTASIEIIDFTGIISNVLLIFSMVLTSIDLNRKK